MPDRSQIYDNLEKKGVNLDIAETRVGEASDGLLAPRCAYLTHPHLSSANFTKKGSWHMLFFRTDRSRKRSLCHLQDGSGRRLREWSKLEESCVSDFAVPASVYGKLWKEGAQLLVVFLPEGRADTYRH
jgi:hypothetical protein